MTRQFDQAFLKKMKSLETEGSHVFPAVHVTDDIMCEVNCLNFSPYAVIKQNQSAVSLFASLLSATASILLERLFLSSFLSFVCALDGGLPCEVIEGQWSCNCFGRQHLANGQNTGREENYTEGAFAL